MKGDATMYENENQNDQTLNNQQQDNIDRPSRQQEPEVNWTIPEAGNPYERAGNRYSQAGGPEGNVHNGQQYGQMGNANHQTAGTGYCHQPTFQGNIIQSSAKGSEQRRNRSSLAKKAAGITAAAVLFGTISGAVMTGVNYIGNRLAGTYKTTADGAKAPAQLQQAAPTAGTQNGGSQGATTVSALTDVSGITEAAMPSIVAINDTMTIEERDFFGMPQTYQAQSNGSGIIVSQNDTELLIATNNHVVSGAQDLKVTFVNNEEVKAAVKGTDSATDLAIIAVQLSDIPSDTMSQIKVAQMGDSDQIKVGQQVLAIGNALGYGQSLTVGYVSALNREITDKSGIKHTYIQTDAAINPGNSGGALLDLNGNVIGINAAKTASTEVEGIGFAIPISSAQDILNDLMTKKTRITVAEDAQGYLGIQGINVDAASSQSFGMPVGIYVYKIVEGGAASRSELREKDIITKFDGQSVTNMEELKQMLTYYEGGSAVTLTVQSLENGSYVERDVQITLSTKSAAQS